MSVSLDNIFDITNEIEDRFEHWDAEYSVRNREIDDLLAQQWGVQFSVKTARYTSTWANRRISIESQFLGTKPSPAVSEPSKLQKRTYSPLLEVILPEEEADYSSDEGYSSDEDSEFSSASNREDAEPNSPSQIRWDIESDSDDPTSPSQVYSETDNIFYEVDDL